MKRTAMWAVAATMIGLVIPARAALVSEGDAIGVPLSFMDSGLLRLQATLVPGFDDQGVGVAVAYDWRADRIQVKIRDDNDRSTSAEGRVAAQALVERAKRLLSAVPPAELTPEASAPSGLAGAFLAGDENPADRSAAVARRLDHITEIVARVAVDDGARYLTCRSALLSAQLDCSE